MRDKFTLTSSLVEVIDTAEAAGLAGREEKLRWYEGIMRYVISDEEPEFSGILGTLWRLAKPIIDKETAEADAEAKSASAKSKRGKRMAATRWASAQADAQDTQKKKEKEKESPNVSLPPTPPITSLPKEKEISKEKEGGEPRENSSCSSCAEHPAARPPKKELSKEFLSAVIAMWNATCAPHMPKLIDIRGTRKGKLLRRLMELGGEKEETDWLAWLRELFDKCARTPFLWGENAKGWRCDFGWLVDNDVNWRKVMEGKYDTSAPKGYDTGIILADNDPHKFDNEAMLWR